MCGRFAFIASYETLKVHYALANSVDITPRFNIAPGADVLCLVKTSSDELQAVVLHWGLIPSWAMDKKKIGSLINARAETLFEKPAFRSAMKTRRCLMLMSGFFEWHVENGIKLLSYFYKDY